MTKSTIVPSIYGYVVCLACVIVFLFGIPSWVEATFDLSDPLRSERAPDIVSKSFEAWRVDFLKDWFYHPEEPDDHQLKTLREPPDDNYLRAMYQAERTSAAENFRHKVVASFFQRLILVILATILFVIHWRWLRKISGSASTGTT